MSLTESGIRKATKWIIAPLLSLILLILSVHADLGPRAASSPISLDRRSLVYILPSQACSPTWTERYGDRIYFYVHADLAAYRALIEADFAVISGVYNTVIIVLPADDSGLFFNNIRTIDELAKGNGLQVIYAIFPNEKYGPEESYLTPGSAMNRLVVGDMRFMAELRATWKVAVWYGWEKRADPTDIVSFYESLPEGVRDRYAVWLDEEYIMPLQGLAAELPRDTLVITEWYQAEGMEIISQLFPVQMIVTGYEGASDAEDWLRHIDGLKRHIRGSDRLLGIWIFYDVNDGAGESLHAYFPGQEPALADPWSPSP